MIKSLMHFGHRTASRLVTQAAFGFTWETVLICLPFLYAAGLVDALFTVIAVAFLNLNLWWPIKRPRINLRRVAVEKMHYTICVGYKNGIPYAVTMAVTQYLIVVGTLNYFELYGSVLALHMFLIARIFDFWNWDLLSERRAAIYTR